jgi:hypothetical protein
MVLCDLHIKYDHDRDHDPYHHGYDHDCVRGYDVYVYPFGSIQWRQFKFVSTKQHSSSCF